MALEDEFAVRARFAGIQRPEKSAQRVYLPSLYGLPGADSNPWCSFWIAACAQGAAVASVRGYVVLEYVLAAVCAILLVVQWKFLTRGVVRRRMSPRRIAAVCAVAVLIILLMFVPWLRLVGNGLGSMAGVPHPPGVGAPKTPETGRPNSGFVGIVLWPPPVKKRDVVAPAPRNLTPGGGMAKPVTIPFDGPYWYFKAPNRQPGPKALVAQGRSTEKTIQSSDWAPLLMEAHQNLGLPIDLTCCREIDVAITNADTRVGRIALAMVVTDNGSPGKPSQNLGLRSIASSEAPQIPKDRAPVAEVLRFPIPRTAAIQRMDAIDVFFVPSKERMRNGAKVSIESFELVP